MNSYQSSTFLAVSISLLLNSDVMVLKAKLNCDRKNVKTKLPYTGDIDQQLSTTDSIKRQVFGMAAHMAIHLLGQNYVYYPCSVYDKR